MKMTKRQCKKAAKKVGSTKKGFMDYVKNYGIKLTRKLADEAVTVYRSENKKVVDSWAKVRTKGIAAQEEEDNENDKTTM